MREGIAGGPPDEVLGEALARATDTRIVEVGAGALYGAADTFASCFGSHTAVVVADETTYEVAGRTVHRVLRSARLPVTDALVFPSRPLLHADFARAAWLRDRLAAHEAIPVAVGAGTINDLTKLAAHLAGRPYMAVATAASMDGYAAFGAAITRDGFKQTMLCPAPRAIVADMDVLAAAPAALTASGFGDLVGKITAGADWLVADALGVEAVDDAIWTMVQPAVRQAVQDAARLGGGEPAAVARLFRCLVMSGLAMQAARSSRPASGAEHQLSHLWEMRRLAVDGHAVSHGFKVGVGTVAVAALYERLLAHDLAQLDVEAVCARWPALATWEAAVRQTHADPALRAQALAEVRAKYVDADGLRVRLQRLRERWPALTERLRGQLLPAKALRSLLATAGCPSEPHEIGLTTAALRASFGAARQIRRRYTVLDLAVEVGLLEPGLEALFAAGGELADWRTEAAAQSARTRPLAAGAGHNSD
ncbi:MAG: sn-glycerol-1-phosphate dehydrogenase [Chloroflexi bacterium]|nr:sn-glycerol-1-phosphate dehydrogenase [Chloroflexota bacterium]